MKQFVLIALLILTTDVALAQGYRGRDFWIAFPQNAVIEGNWTLSLSLNICAEARANVIVANLMTGDTERFTVEYGSSIERAIDTEIELRTSGEIGKQSLHVTSDGDISLYVVSHRRSSTDSYMAIPTRVLGTEYMVAGYATLPDGMEGFTSQSAIIAAEDNTFVTVHLAGPMRGTVAGIRNLSIPMMRGESFQFQGDFMQGDPTRGDLTGSTISSTKPIAFFTGHTCAQVPPATQFCNILMETEPPMRDWGQKFVLTKFEGKQFYVARVIAGEDSTRVFLDGKPYAMLRKSEHCEIDTLHGDAVISTSKPALVAQYCTGNQADTSKIGDPFMLFIVPTERFISDVTTATLTHGRWQHYLNIVVPDTAVRLLKVDGQVEQNNHYPAGSELLHVEEIASIKCKIVTVRVQDGRHRVQCAAPIGVYEYGFGEENNNYDSYGNACGMRLE